MDKKRLLMIAAAGGAATMLGAFLPWATLSDEGLGGALKALGQSVSVSGIDGGDGIIVLVLGAIGAAAAVGAFLGKLGNKMVLVGAICLALAALVSIIDFMDISGPVSVGIGLWLCLIGSVVGTAAAFVGWKGGAAAAPAAGS